MGIIADVLCELLWPTRCSGCDIPGTLLCEECGAALPLIDDAHACHACGAPHGWLVCTECWNRELPFESAVCVGVLEHPLSRIVTLYKDGGERRLASELGTRLADAVLARRWHPDIVCAVPASRAAVARRGFDHADTIARDVATRLDISHRVLLCRRRVRDQRALGREARAVNVRGSFQLLDEPGHVDVLLVDDVFTTGATLIEATRVLLEGGASSVRVATIARTW